MSRWRHFLGGTLVEDPDGWDGFKEEIVRDYDKRLLYTQYPNTLSFYATGYAILRTAYELDYCGSVDYRLEQECSEGWQVVMRGKAILADVVWDRVQCSAEVPITDTGAGARILNNLSLEVYPAGENTKNGETQAAAPEFELAVFDNTGGYLGTRRIAYDLLECLKHAAIFVSDGDAEIVSDFYSALPEDEKIALVWGQQLRVGLSTDTRSPKLTLGKLLEFVTRAYNLWGGVYNNTDGTCTLRLEPEAYWHSGTSAFALPDLGQLKEEIDEDQLFAKIDLGTDSAERNENLTEANASLPFIGLRTFSDETYNVEGECNTDTALDLRLPFVCCTNAIERALAGNTDNDARVFAVQYNETNGRATIGSYLSSTIPPALYNEQLLNGSVLARYTLPGAVASYYDATDAVFRAEATVNEAAQNLGPVGYTIPRVQYDDDYTAPNFDTGNNYGNGTVQGNPVSQANSVYTAPAEGVYSFSASVVFRLSGTQAPGPTPGNPLSTSSLGVNYNLSIRRYNSSNVLQQVLSKYSGGPNAPVPSTVQPLYADGVYVEDFTATLYMDAGDYVEVVASFARRIANLSGSTTVGVQVIRGGVFYTVYAAPYGGVLPSPDPLGAYIVKYTSEWPVSLEQWEQLRGDLALGIDIGTLGVSPLRAYLCRVARNTATGLVEWEWIANRRGS